MQTIDGMSDLVRRKLKWVEEEFEGGSKRDDGKRLAIQRVALGAVAALAVVTVVQLARRWWRKRQAAPKPVNDKAPRPARPAAKG